MQDGLGHVLDELVRLSPGARLSDAMRSSSRTSGKTYRGRH